MSRFDEGRNFLAREGRVLEQRVAATVFDGESGEGALRALDAYRNDDGGFGHGLEPDKLCPDSQPLDGELALDVVLAIGARAPGWCAALCDHLADAGGERGAVGLVTAAIERFPHAAHWGSWAYAPGLNPTAGLVGRLQSLGVAHRWIARAKDYCWVELAGGLPLSAHALLESLIFLAGHQDDPRVEGLVGGVVGRLGEVEMFKLDPAVEGYGLTPLHLAPTPDSPWRGLLEPSTLDAHLEALLAAQGSDGGWPLDWQPPSVAATFAYRGIETLRALRTLVAYGALAP